MKWYTSTSARLEERVRRVQVNKLAKMSPQNDFRINVPLIYLTIIYTKSLKLIKSYTQLYIYTIFSCKSNESCQPASCAHFMFMFVRCRCICTRA